MSANLTPQYRKAFVCDRPVGDFWGRKFNFAAHLHSCIRAKCVSKEQVLHIYADHASACKCQVIVVRAREERQRVQGRADTNTFDNSTDYATMPRIARGTISVHVRATFAQL